MNHDELFAKAGKLAEKIYNEPSAAQRQRALYIELAEVGIQGIQEGIGILAAEMKIKLPESRITAAYKDKRADGEIGGEPYGYDEERKQ